MCTRPVRLNRAASVGERYLQLLKTPAPSVVPCGVCPDCLSKRQSAVTIRCYEMSKQYGDVQFLTLTYKEEMLPLSLSVWKHIEDGEVCIGAPQVVRPEAVSLKWILEDNTFTKVPVYIDTDYRRKFLSLSYSHKPLADARILECRPEYSDYLPDDIYFKITACHDISHVQRLIKRCRMRYERSHGHVEWKYLCVSEFGIQNTRRPHYHLLFFGCPKELVEMIRDGWQYGMFRDLKPNVDEDGNILSYRRIQLNPAYGDALLEKVVAKKSDDKNYDGYSAIASYVGKYVAKGKFEVDSVKLGLCYVPRLVVSHGLGRLTSSQVDYFLCKDKYQYDILDSSTYPEGLVEDVLDRMNYRLPYGKHPFTLPTYYTNQIFGRRCFRSRLEVRKWCKELTQTAFSYVNWPDSGKTFYYPLYYLVQSRIRDRNIQEDTKEFQAYKANHPTIPLSALADSFEAYKQANRKDREEIKYQRLLRKLLKSKY